MSTSLAVVRYDVTEAWIAERKAESEAISFDTPAHYTEGRKALQLIRETRTAVERRRTELNADALKWTREVNAEAKRLTALLLEIETPLKAKKDAVDEEKERAKREAEELRRWVEQEAEAARQAEERKKIEEAARIERERFAAERAEFEKQRAAEAEARKEAEAAARLERQKLDAERAALEAEKRLLREAEERKARIEAERVERQRAAEEAKERVERERREVEEREAAEKARLEALKPDIEKMKNFAVEIRKLAAAAPVTTSQEASVVIACAVHDLTDVATTLEYRSEVPA